MNNLAKRVKRVKRVAFGFSSFRNYRIRALCRQAKLGSTSDDHTPLVSEVPSMERLVQEVRSAGNCSHTLRLRGELINLATGEIRPSSLRVACKDRCFE